MAPELKENLSIVKTNWIPVKFGAIAFEPKENAKDIYNEDIEHVVGLEHIDSENIHINRSGELEETTTFTKKFKKGDVLFGRRRAYLRKAAIASFDGICSGDITVLRPTKSLLPELLPFIVNNEKFFDHAIKHSAGGLSPRVKFKDLANYEFLLPPKDQQAKLANLLWSLDEVIEHEKEVLKKVNSQSEVYLNKSFRVGAFLNQNSKDTEYGSIPENWILKKLCELGDFKNGINKDKDQFGFGKPFINLLDVFGYKELWKKKFDLVNASEEELKSFDIKKGDVLFIRSSVKPSGVGLTTLIQEDIHDTVYSGFLIRFRTKNNELTQLFKKYCFYESRFRNNLIKRSTVSANTNINQESLNKLIIPVPPKNEQIELTRVLNNYENIASTLESKIASSITLQKNLIHQIF